MKLPFCGATNRPKTVGTFEFPEEALVLVNYGELLNHYIFCHGSI